MTATNHNDHLGEIYPTMLNELNCTFGVSFSRFRCCGRHGHGLCVCVLTINGVRTIAPWTSAPPPYPPDICSLPTSTPRTCAPGLVTIPDNRPPASAAGRIVKRLTYLGVPLHLSPPPGSEKIALIFNVQKFLCYNLNSFENKHLKCTPLSDF